ncbi:MAG: C69 family dipeptidase [Leptospiraceae bacterium]|nr:C69 family dipeptidase [Leptospiraceae bacterium]
MLFAKNSDREPNEAQILERVPARDHQKGESLQTTFIRIPQVESTREVLLSRPFQMWGAEMGANADGVVIGNEAVFTRIPFRRDNSGLTGMDMLRLALERSSTARAAFDLIGSLIEQYGQDACGGYTDQKFYYHNSFLICDSSSAYVLESAGRHWVGVRVRGFRSISNGLTIESEFDFSSAGLADFARQKGWLRPHQEFNFRQSFSDRFMTHFSHARFRRACSTRLGSQKSGTLDIRAMMSILRSHGSADGQGGDFHPGSAGMQSLCLHASGLTAPSQTTASLVAELRPQGQPSTIWATGTAAPCLSVFKPVYFPGQSLGATESKPAGPQADQSLWWQHERLHRAALRNYGQVHSLVESRQAALEQEFIDQDAVLVKQNAAPAERDEWSRSCFERSRQLLDDLLAQIPAAVPAQGWRPFYRRYWQRLNRAAGLVL